MTRGRDANVEQVRLARRVRPDGVAQHVMTELEYAAAIADAQAVAQDPFAPRVVVRLAFYAGDGGHIVRCHGPYGALAHSGGGVHDRAPSSTAVSASSARTALRSCQAFAFS